MNGTDMAVNAIKSFYQNDKLDTDWLINEIELLLDNDEYLTKGMLNTRRPAHSPAYEALVKAINSKSDKELSSKQIQAGFKALGLDFKDILKPAVQFVNDRREESKEEFDECVDVDKLEEGLNNTEIIDKLNELCDKYNPYADKNEAEKIRSEVKQILQDAPDGIEMYRVGKDTSSGWTSHGNYSNERTVLKKYEKQNNIWKMNGYTKKDLDDAVLGILYNSGKFMTKEQAEKEKETQQVNDKSTHRDIINIDSEHGISTNRVDYPNKKTEDVSKPVKGVLTHIMNIYNLISSALDIAEKQNDEACKEITGYLYTAMDNISEMDSEGGLGLQLENKRVKIDEKLYTFPTEKEKDEYIEENNLEKNIDYKDKGIHAIETLDDKESDSELDNESNDDKEEKTIYDYIQDRIGQKISVGEFNNIMQSLFAKYTELFLSRSDLYNQDENEPQEVVIFDDEDMYTITYKIVDLENSIIEITDVDVE